MKYRTGWMALGLCLASLISGCNVKTSDKDLAFIEPAKAETLVLGKKKLLGLAGKTTGVWVDPRGRADYLEGHIPGAIHLPFEDLQKEHRQLEGYNPIVVYGNTYNSPVAAAMSKGLIELGYKNVNTLRGGLHAWKAAGNTVDEGE